LAGAHLADQLLLPFASAGSGAFTAKKLNIHFRTDMEIIGRFLPIDFATNQEGKHSRIVVKAAR
jgi:RNA 3'-terminal phosphate cyclase (ATP)